MQEELVGHGGFMTIELNHAVIHQLVKESKQRIQPSDIREELLDCSLESVQKLVDDVVKLYGTRDNNATFGTFAAAEEEPGRFPTAFETFRVEQQSPQAFLTLTKIAMQSLFNRARDVNFASGGYILFASYQSNQKAFFLVAMIKQREGLQLDENLVPVGITELDLNKLHQAARINVERYVEYSNATPEERDELSYLSFVSPKANQSASGYFIKALGCSGGVAASAATNSAISGMGNFFNQRAELRQHKTEVKSDVFSYLRECITEKKTGSISDLVGIARRNLPAAYEEEERNRVANELAEYLNSEDVKVPAEFIVHAATVNKRAKIKLKTDNWQIQFEKHSVGRTEDAEIFFDRENSRLVINQLTPQVLSEISDSLSD